MMGIELSQLAADGGILGVVGWAFYIIKRQLDRCEERSKEMSKSLQDINTILVQKSWEKTR